MGSHSGLPGQPDGNLCQAVNKPIFGGWLALNPWLAEQACLVRWCDLWWLVEAWLWLECIKMLVPLEAAEDLKREAAWVNCFKKNWWLRFPCWSSWMQQGSTMRWPPRTAAAVEYRQIECGRQSVCYKEQDCRSDPSPWRSSENHVCIPNIG